MHLFAKNLRNRKEIQFDCILSVATLTVCWLTFADGNPAKEIKNVNKHHGGRSSLLVFLKFNIKHTASTMENILEPSSSDDNMPSDNKKDLQSLLSSEDDFFDPPPSSSRRDSSGNEDKPDLRTDFEDIIMPEMGHDNSILMVKDQKDRERDKRKETKSKRELEEEEREKMQ